MYHGFEEICNLLDDRVYMIKKSSKGKAGKIFSKESSRIGLFAWKLKTHFSPSLINPKFKDNNKREVPFIISFIRVLYIFIRVEGVDTDNFLPLLFSLFADLPGEIYWDVSLSILLQGSFWNLLSSNSTRNVIEKPSLGIERFHSGLDLAFF